MSAPALTLAAVRKLNPCEESYDRVAAILPKRGKITAQQARDAGCTLDDIVWVAVELARRDKEVDRRVRHWSADCAAHVLHFYEQDYPNDHRPRAAIQAGRDFADGRIDAAARAAAGGAARAAARAAALDAGDAAGAAWAAALAAAGAAARAAAEAAAWDAGDAAGAAWAAALAAGNARAAEEAFQFDRLILWLSDETPEPWPLPALAQKVPA